MQKRFEFIMRRDDQKDAVFKISKRMVNTNQGIIREQYMRSNNGALAVKDENKKIAWKNYHSKLLNTRSLHGIGTVCLKQIQ